MLKVNLLVALLLLFSLAVADEVCPHDLEVRCIDDINKAYPVCTKSRVYPPKPADL